MAGPAQYHGQGRRRATLSQRSRSQDAVRRAAAARTDRRAADAPPDTRLRDGSCASSPRPARDPGLARRCGDRGDRRISRTRSENHPAACAGAAAAVAEPRRRPKQPTGSSRTGRWRTATGSIMSARAPRLSRCPMPGSSRWSSRAFTCSPGPACSRTAIISNASAFIPSPQSIHTDETTLRRFGYANVFDDHAGAGVVGLVDRRRLKMSTACRSALRG